MIFDYCLQVYEILSMLYYYKSVFFLLCLRSLYLSYLETLRGVNVMTSVVSFIFFISPSYFYYLSVTPVTFSLLLSVHSRTATTKICNFCHSACEKTQLNLTDCPSQTMPPLIPRSHVATPIEVKFSKELKAFKIQRRHIRSRVYQLI